MLLKNTNRILWGSLILGLCFDLLFWKKPLGISYFLFVSLTVIAGFALAWLFGRKPAGASWLLAGMTLFFSALTFVRAEPFTIFINVLLSLASLILLALTFSSGLWLKYSLADAITGFFRLAGSALGGGSTLLAASRKSEDEEPQDPQVQKSKPVSLWAIVRGLLLAFPIVFFLALLLISADPVFSQELKKILDLERFVEYAVRLVIIGIIAYILSGIYFYSLQKSHRSDLIGLEKPWFTSFLGFTESAIILAGVNLLFGFFVVVQFKYFFGGQSNIMVDGFTYAEYARKGFGELVWVAVLSLMLFLGLSAITRRTSARKQRWFSGFCLLLVCLVGVILVSSFIRLGLLEEAYGFTRLRTYSHVFMIWLAVLLAAVMVMEVIPYRRGFAIAAFFTVAGFGLTLNAINVDSFIVNANVIRTGSGKELDYQYFQTLSTDSVPQTLIEFRNSRDGETRHLLGTSLACRSAMLEDQLEKWQWQGFNISYNTAVVELQAAKPELKDYTVNRDKHGAWRSYTVDTPIGEKECFTYYREMD